MESKNVIDKRSVKLSDVMRADYIPFLGGRPARMTVIGSEDALNLAIALAGYLPDSGRYYILCAQEPPSVALSRDYQLHPENREDFEGI